jgi:hypothetical protein
MARGSIVAFAAAAVLLVPPLAGASSVERVRVAGPGVTSAFPRGVSLVLSSPPDYARASVAADEGRWTGPEYWASGNAGKRGTSSIRWSVDFQARPGTAKSVVLSSSTHGWPLEKKDPIAIPHYIGKRVVGTILGFYSINRSPPPNDAAYEADLAFPVAPRAFSVVRFDLLDPPTDLAGEFGNYLVRGLDLPSLWNRGQAFWALSGVSLLGNLPATRIELSVSGRAISGYVSDAFHHPVIGLPVSFQHRTGNSWRPLTSIRTNGKGEISLRGLARGDYRAVASSTSGRVVSRAVYVS